MPPKNPQDNFFRATAAPGPRTLLEKTTEAARQIISDETTHRDANILRLRALRLAAEAKQKAAPTTGKGKKKLRQN